MNSQITFIDVNGTNKSASTLHGRKKVNWNPGEAMPEIDTEYAVFISDNDIVSEDFPVSMESRLDSVDMLVPGICIEKAEGGHITETFVGKTSDLSEKFESVGNKIKCLEGIAFRYSLIKNIQTRKFRWQTFVLLRLLHKCETVKWTESALYVQNRSEPLDPWIATLFNALSALDIIEEFKEIDFFDVEVVRGQFSEYWKRLNEMEPSPELAAFCNEYAYCVRAAQQSNVN